MQEQGTSAKHFAGASNASRTSAIASHAAPAATAAATATAATRTASDAELKKLSKAELVQIIDALSNGEAIDDQTAQALDAEKAKLEERSRFRRVLASTIGALVVVAAAAVLVSTLFFPVLQVSGSSMEPTLHEGEVLVLAKSASFSTGDLVSFNWQNRLLIKRVIAGPGDVVSIDADGVVSVNGEELDEPYVDELALGTCDLTFPYQVPDGRYFVLGDHRSTSIDSRSSDIGCVEAKQIVGKVMLRVWPLSEISFVG